MANLYPGYGIVIPYPSQPRARVPPIRAPPPTQPTSYRAMPTTSLASPAHFFQAHQQRALVDALPPITLRSLLPPFFFRRALVCQFDQASSPAYGKKVQARESDICSLRSACMATLSIQETTKQISREGKQRLMRPNKR